MSEAKPSPFEALALELWPEKIEWKVWPSETFDVNAPHREKAVRMAEAICDAYCRLYDNYKPDKAAIAEAAGKELSNGT